MSQHERTGERDLTYSGWHRFPNLPHQCYMTDIDCVEVRPGSGIVALIEVSHESANRDNKLFTFDIMERIARELNVPAYYVTYNSKIATRGENDDELAFTVEDLRDPDADIIHMTNAEYRRFIRNL